MATQFNIPQTGEQVVNTSNLIINSFGLQGVKTLIYDSGVKKSEAQAEPVTSNEYLDKTPPFNGVDSYAFDSSLPSYTGYLGNAVLSDLDIDPKTTGYERIQIPTVLFTVTQKKNIISTAVQGRNGTIKEYISDGDFQISIRGVLTSINGVYPKERTIGNTAIFQDLFNICTLNKAVSVNSWYLKQFGIYNIVITDYNFPQNEGEYAMQPFEITAISDTPFELNITQ